MAALTSCVEVTDDGEEGGEGGGLRSVLEEKAFAPLASWRVPIN